MSGGASQWSVTADRRSERNHAFCPTCGTPVYLTFEAMPGLTAIHAASLDEPGQFNPQAVTYSARGLAWDTLDPALKRL